VGAANAPATHQIPAMASFALSFEGRALKTTKRYEFLETETSRCVSVEILEETAHYCCQILVHNTVLNAVASNLLLGQHCKKSQI
jgi:hypothetical protein